jgi:SNF2 family DNA or RNA helicase
MADSELGLSDLKAGLVVSGIVPDQSVTIVAVRPMNGAVTVYYDAGDGSTFGQEIIDQQSVQHLSLVQQSSRSLPFDANPEEFRLAAEALRIKYAAQYDPMSAVYSSNIDPLPHQIRAVYEDMLPKVPLRFLLADDPGAGKTIMAGLYIKEMLLRSAAERIIIACPGGLAEQWHDELSSKFGLEFEVFDPYMQVLSPTGNPFRDHQLLICRMDQVARDDDRLAMLGDVHWDIAIVDEAHRMSAHFKSAKGDITRTSRYRLGETLSRTAENLLLMTATPHSGKEEDFQLFMALLDPDRFAGKYRSKIHHTDTKGLMRRMVKEDLLTFDGKPLFPERRAETVDYRLSPQELDLYEHVTEYVRSGMGQADRLKAAGDARRGNSVGFALTILQRRLASSPEAILRSLERRKQRLSQRLDDLEHDSRVIDAPVVGDGYGADRFDEDQYEDMWEEAAEDQQHDLESRLDEVVDSATAAQTKEELIVEIHTLDVLVAEARVVRNSGQDAKWRELSSILSDNVLESGSSPMPHKLIIFTEHRDTLNYLQRRVVTLLGRPEAVVTIHGGLNRDERRQRQHDFVNNPAARILIATDAAGEGLNLQRANLMVNYDLPWNPNRIEQRFGRIHRIGQKQVCWLWNLMARNTREGDVYLRLLSKIAQMKTAYNGNLFNVLGDSDAFEGRPLKDLMIDAIRYGDRDDVKAQLNRTIDSSVANGLEELVKEKSANTSMYPSLDVRKVRELMEQTRERKLQPGYIAAFFLAAFKRLNGAARLRESQRWQLTHVPATIRSKAASLNRHEQLAQAYERVTFETSRVSLRDDTPDAILIAPGEPLLTAVIELIIERFGSTLDHGTVFIDRTDTQPENPVLMAAAEQTITDGRERVISQHFDYLQIPNNADPQFSIAPPYLDYEPARADEQPAVRLVLDSDWIRNDQSGLVRDWVYTKGTRPRLDELTVRKQADNARVLQQVRDRLQAEIEYWYAQYNILLENERNGRANKRMTASAAQKRAQSYERRLAAREQELGADVRLHAKPALIRGMALVIPEHALHEQTDVEDVVPRRRPRLFAKDTTMVDRRAVDATLSAEKHEGRHPHEMPHNNKGYDIQSVDALGNRYFIEVKGRIAGAEETFTVTSNEVVFAQTQKERHFLSLVIVSPEGADHDRIRYIEHAFDRIVPSDSTTSYNERFKDYWDRGTDPR